MQHVAFVSIHIAFFSPSLHLRLYLHLHLHFASCYHIVRLIHGHIDANDVHSTGSGESGKSTIVKQMKIIHQNGYTTEELMTFRTTIYRNLLESAKNIINAMKKYGEDCEKPANRVRSSRACDLGDA